MTSDETNNCFFAVNIRRTKGSLGGTQSSLMSTKVGGIHNRPPGPKSAPGFWFLIFVFSAGKCNDNNKEGQEQEQ